MQSIGPHKPAEVRLKSKESILVPSVSKLNARKATLGPRISKPNKAENGVDNAK